ncbi:MAG: D-isomer specific 2-hydroxyacid dehydrogenase NAD-binding protein [Paenibacillaceae bacterium]|nr:D-isomer specific 2-hydroxyacid dehydrogenase NAD-binding protein [Paenibacillaceae bacterium]
MQDNAATSLKPKAAFFTKQLDRLASVYGQGRKERVAELVDLYPEVVNGENFAEHAGKLGDLEVIFSTWGMPALSDEQLDRMPKLKAVFYAAGTVKNFAVPFLRRGIIVVSAWAANAIPVSEFTLAQILLSTKNYFRDVRQYREAGKRVSQGRGNFGETVALIGAGQIGRRMIGLLKPFNLNVLAYDPYLTEGEARELGVEKVTLEEAFERAIVVSNHAPNIPATVGMLHGGLFERMREGATFINTGRGATVCESELLRVMQERPDLTALLDVTDSPSDVLAQMRAQPNMQLSSHIAGSLGDEHTRLADYAIEEFISWRDSQPLRYAVTESMLETMA